MSAHRLTAFHKTALRLFAGFLFLSCASAWAGPLDEMSLERWAKLREAERYQLQIAEKYFTDKKWQVAGSEYEKFLTLYDRSEGASYAHLKWSLCLVEQRKLNTAVRDGFQTIVDYWPASPEAVTSSYLIGRSFKDMGDVKKAKAQYAKVLADHPKHLAAVYAKQDLLALARTEGDDVRRMALLKELTFDVERDKHTANLCAAASRELAEVHFRDAALTEGKAALATTYNEKQLPEQLVNHVRGAVWKLTETSADKPKGQKLADGVIEFLRTQTPSPAVEEADKNRAKQLWYWVAEMHSAARRPEKILEVYDQMLKEFGVDDGLLNRMADWYKSQNRRDDARKTYARYTDENAGLGKIAESFAEERKWDDALKIYRDLLVRDPDNVTRWQWSLAHTLRHAGRYKEAAGTYRVIEGFPDNLNYMAICHRELKEFGEAVTLYNQVMSSESHAPEALLQIGYTYEQAGQKEKAIQTFQQVCRRFPKHGQASRAHAHLQNAYKITATLGGAKDD